MSQQLSRSKEPTAEKDLTHSGHAFREDKESKVMLPTLTPFTQTLWLTENEDKW